jgi:MATE family multidrug resistance protein
MSSSRSLPRELLHLAWPVLIAQAAVMATSVIDTLMAGRLSALDLAAVGIGASIYATVFVTAMGVLLALTPVVSPITTAPAATPRSAPTCASAPGWRCCCRSPPSRC